MKHPTYMISGHIDLTREQFDKYYKPQIDEVPKGSHFIMGNALGADSFALEYINDKSTITVVCKDDRHLPTEKGIKVVYGFNSFPDRDGYMTSNSNHDIAFLRNDTMALGSGTMMNLMRRQYSPEVATLFKNHMRRLNDLDKVLAEMKEVDPEQVKLMLAKHTMM
jgi:hypothetical protein